MKIFRTFRSDPFGDVQGQSLVETALLFPMLLLLFTGIVDLGWMAYNYIELANAANAGVHYAAQNVTAAAQTSSIQAAMNSDAANMTSISPNVSMACTCSDSSKRNSDGSTPSCSTYDGCTAPARLIDTVKTINPLIPWPGIPGSVTMHSSAAMQVEQ